MEIWEIILLVAGLYLLVMLLYSLLLYVIIKVKTGKREDENELLTYFTVEDYPSLRSEDIRFKNKRDEKLAGKIYFKDNIIYNRVILFFPGFGPGHIAYTTLINDLVMTNELPVITFDYSGTGASEGKKIRDFLDAVVDAGCLINFLKGQEEFLNTEFLLIGHSWGGFVATNLAPLYPFLKIKRIVSLNGVTNFPKMFQHMTKAPFIFPFVVRGINYLFYKKIAFTTTKRSIKKTTIPHLFIHGQKDDAVPVYPFVNELMAVNEDEGLVKFHLENTKYHNAYLTLESEQNLRSLQSDLKELDKVKFNRPLREKIMKIDFTKLVENDEIILERIKTFFTIS
ncbi:MAG TPA: alpha/beta fold hydrolase [Bacilli bacterium]|nr:alpha/beta fold hydrolase [Bacilli bacterium]